MGCGGSTATAAEPPKPPPAASPPAAKPAEPAKAEPKPAPAPEPAKAPDPAPAPAAEEKKAEPAPAAAEPAAAPAASEEAPKADVAPAKPKVFVVGPPSSGKGFVVSSLVKDHGMIHIRETWLLKTAQTKSLKSAEGVEALDDASTAAILKEVVVDVGTAGCVIDGLPKNEAQAGLMADTAVDKLVVIDVSQEDLLAYHANRVFDPETMQGYDTVNNPPPEDVAARCTRQPMDEPDKVKEKLAPYFELLPKITAAFGDKVLTVKGTTVSGGDAEAAVYKEVCAQLQL